MTPECVHHFLHHIGKQWSNRGVAMELGCWLGASSVPLLEGLVQAGYNRPFWAFDMWKASPQQVQEAFKQGQEIVFGQDLIPVYRSNVRGVYKDVLMVRGRLPQSLSNFTNEPIEICVFDAPKRNDVFNQCIDLLKPYFIPGVTVLGLLDFYSYKKKTKAEQYNFMAPVDYVSRGWDILADWPDKCSCAFFKMRKDAVDSE